MSPEGFFFFFTHVLFIAHSFFLSVLEKWRASLLASSGPDETPLSFGLPRHVLCPCSPATFNNFLLSLRHRNSITMGLGIDFFEFTLFGIHPASKVCKFGFYQIWGVFRHFFKYFFWSHSPLSYWAVWTCLSSLIVSLVSETPLKFFSAYFLLFTLGKFYWFIYTFTDSTCLSPLLHYSVHSARSFNFSHFSAL